MGGVRGRGPSSRAARQVRSRVPHRGDGPGPRAGTARVMVRSIGIVAPPAPPGSFGRSLGDFARQLWWERRLRTGFFPPEILGEPAWDLILHLFASEAAGADTRLSKAHEGACVPPSAAVCRARTLMALGIVREADAAGKARGREIGLAPLARSRLEHLLIEMAVQRDVRRDDGAAASKPDACDARTGLPPCSRSAAPRSTPWPP